MAGGSSRLYRQRKLRQLPFLVPRPVFRLGVLPYHDRPHVTLPELVEEPVRVFIPFESSSSPSGIGVICQYDTGAQYDAGGQYDTPCVGPVPPIEAAWDEGQWDSGLQWDS